MSLQAIIFAALSLGFLGSFHCIGMCGPIALSLPVAHLSGYKRIVGILLYNFGRIFTYGLLGLAFGFIGMQFSLFGWEQRLSIALGVLLILIFLFTVIGKRIGFFQRLQSRWNAPIINTLSTLMKKNSLSTLFIIGVLNGLLPCGLVYMAIVGSLATANPYHGAVFMSLFGLGTLPAMMSITLLGNLVSLKVRNKIKTAMPYLTLLVGVLLIIRGLNLNIPYMSPKIQEEKVDCCH